jgi:hypothetical protein
MEADRAISEQPAIPYWGLTARGQQLMKLPAVPLLLLLSSGLLQPQATSDNAKKQARLATLAAHVDKTVYKGGERIQVTLTLRAGPQGAYVSKWSKVTSNDKQNALAGRYMGNVSGFDVSLLTLDGKNAETVGHAGVADRFGPAPSPSERFKDEFLFLNPCEEETWRGSVDGTAVKAGRYQIVGAYMPDYEQVRELHELPETQGLLIADVVRSTPVIITIK